MSEIFKNHLNIDPKYVLKGAKIGGAITMAATTTVEAAGLLTGQTSLDRPLETLAFIGLTGAMGATVGGLYGSMVPQLQEAYKDTKHAVKVLKEVTPRFVESLRTTEINLQQIAKHPKLLVASAAMGGIYSGMFYGISVVMVASDRLLQPLTGREPDAFFQSMVDNPLAVLWTGASFGTAVAAGILATRKNSEDS